MRSEGLVWLRNGISNSFRPSTQLIDQYYGLNDSSVIVSFGSFCRQNRENTCFEALDMLRLLECTNIDLGQSEKVFDICCMCLKLVLGSYLTLQIIVGVFS